MLILITDNYTLNRLAMGFIKKARPIDIYVSLFENRSVQLLLEWFHFLSLLMYAKFFI